MDHFLSRVMIAIGSHTHTQQFTEAVFFHNKSTNA
jgi:hypothetical protein